MKEKLNKVLESSLFNLVIQTLIVCSIIQLSLETLPNLSIYQNEFSRIEVILVIIFSIEYLIRIYVAEKKLEFIFSFFGIIDLLSILPSILTVGVFDMRVLRGLRLLRVFRILKLMRYSRALERIKDAFDEVKEELIIFFFMSFIIVYLSAAGIYFFEKDVQPEVFKSIPHSVWWAITTITTVGYGDAYPVTTGGKIFTTIILIIGLAIVGVPAGLFASAFSNDPPKDSKET